MRLEKDEDGPDTGSSSELIANLASVIKEASTALARLGDSATEGDLEDGKPSGEIDLAGAAAALAKMASKIEGGRAIAAVRGERSRSADRRRQPDKHKRHRSRSQGSVQRVSPRRSEPRARRSVSRDRGKAAEDEVRDFVSSHGLDSWVADALLLLTHSQLRSVMDPQLNVETARNPNNVVISRVKQVTSVEQRVQMFIKVNDLAESVVDRLSTLTPEQCEGVMDSGIKILRANNPSGVAMARITNVLKTMNDRGGRTISLRERQGHGRHDRDDVCSRRERSQSRRRKDRREDDDFPPDVKHLMQELGLKDWCGEVLKRSSLQQRKNVVRELGSMRGVRNPSGVVMSRIKTVLSPEELIAIFVDINSLDKVIEAILWELTPDQRMEVLAPGIYVQNVTNTCTAVRSRIVNVLQGKSAMNRPPLLQLKDDAAKRDHRDKSQSHGNRRHRRRESGSSRGSGSGSPAAHRGRRRARS